MLFIIFVHINMGHAHFQSNQICIFWEPTKPAKVFSVVKQQKTWLEKSGSKSVESCFVKLRKTPPSSKSVSVKQVLFSLYFLDEGYFYQ